MKQSKHNKNHKSGFYLLKLTYKLLYANINKILNCIFKQKNMINLKKLFFPKLYEKQENQNVKNKLNILLIKIKDSDIVFEK